MRRSLAALAAYVVLTLVATHPLWQRLGDTLPGDIGDPVLNVYILAWDAHALVSDPLNLFNANIYYPLPNTLAYSENLVGDALLALPIMLVTGQPTLAYNFVFLSSFVLSGFGMYLFMLRLTREPLAAFVAGVAFAFAPYRLASLAHIQLLAVQWLPFVTLCLFQIAKITHPRSRLVPLLIAVWLQIASTLHGALFAALLVLVFVAIRLLRAPRPTLHASRLNLIALVSFISFLLCLALPYVFVLDELRAARPPDVAQSFLAAPTDFLAAYPWNRVFGGVTEGFRQRDGFTEEQTLFMGVVTPLLALVGIIVALRHRWGFVLLAVCSLLLMLSGWLVQALPLASLMRVPARWGVVLTFALAGLCGVGLAQLQTTKTRSCVALFHSAARRARHTGQRTQRKTFAVFASSRFAFYFLLGALIFVEGFSAPIPLAKIGTLTAQPAVYHALAQQAGHDAVVELPMYVAPDAEYPEGKRMYASVLHWRPLVNGYSGFTPARQMALAAQLKNFPDEASLAALRELAQQGVRFVIVHSGEPGILRREWVQTNRERALRSGALRLVQSFGDDDLLEIVR